MKKTFCFYLCTVLAFFAFLDMALGVTPEQLKEMIDRGDKVTVIDIRSSVLYEEEHIEGAINIPYSVLARKRLPAIGTVVIYGDGIRTDNEIDAVNNLNSRNGIQASILDGGFPSWESYHMPSTREKGFAAEKFRYLSFEDFEKTAAGNSDIILVDLRNGKVQETDLSKKFSNVKIIKSSVGSILSQGITKKDKIKHRSNLYVLIDDGNGDGEKAARRLKTAGIKRVAILAGGETALKRDGQAGSRVIEKSVKVKK